MRDTELGNFRLPKQVLVSRMRLDLTLLVVERTEFLEMLSATRSVFYRQRFDPPKVHYLTADELVSGKFF